MTGFENLLKNKNNLTDLYFNNEIIFNNSN